jgi:hypothetical protein
MMLPKNKPSSMTMLTVLIPHRMPERCYLSEAVLWVAINRIPCSFVTENNIESREDYDYFDNMEPYVPDEGIITVEECEQLGLEPNPYWEEINSSKTHASPEILHDLLLSEKDNNRRQELEKELSESKDFRKRQAEWDASFKEFIDVRRNKLFLSLSEGRIGAVGKKLPQPTLEWSSDLDEWEWLRNSPWEVIPATFWISYKIDWDMSRAEGRGGAYSFIMTPTADLMREFPLPQGQAVSGVVRIGNDLVMNSGAGTVVEMQRKGRPAQNWDEFHLEVAKWVARGELPDKQDSFIEEMRAWCKTHWGRHMGRSTLLEKIKPYYDTFVRSKVTK